MLTSSSGNVPVLKELCCLVPVYFFDPDIRPPARRAKAHLHGLGFAFAPGVRGAITPLLNLGMSSSVLRKKRTTGYSGARGDHEVQTTSKKYQFDVESGRLARVDNSKLALASTSCMTEAKPPNRAIGVLSQVAAIRRRTRTTAQQSSGNRVGYDDTKSERYQSSRGLTSLTVGDRAICPRPLLSATQSVLRACIVDLKLASASASAQPRSRGVDHAFDLTSWARTAALNGAEPTHRPRLIRRRSSQISRQM